jgi:hypothetical protein
MSDRRPGVGRPSAGDPQQLWRNLGGDAATADDAIRHLMAVPAAGVPLLKARLRPVPETAARRVARLLKQLDSPRFAERQRAADELANFDDMAGPALRRALAGKPSLEFRRRAEQLLKKWAGPITSPDALRALRAVEVLERIGTPEARQVLEAVAGGAAEARLTRQARASLGRLAARRRPPFQGRRSSR